MLLSSKGKGWKESNGQHALASLAVLQERKELRRESPFFCASKCKRESYVQKHQALKYWKALLPHDSK